MGTGIYNEMIPGIREEVKQESIDFWCDLCQFPLDPIKCQSRESIQRCWNEIGSNAGVWHIFHECPFTHIDQKCHCNDFKNIKTASTMAGLTYKEGEL